MTLSHTPGEELWLPGTTSQWIGQKSAILVVCVFVVRDKFTS